MRPSRLACAILASLNVFFAAAKRAPEGGGEIAARAPLPEEAAMPEKPRGAAVEFRPRGEGPAPARAPTRAQAPRPTNAAPAAEAAADAGPFAYLGAMTAADGTSSYFFKDRTTDRVYSSGTRGCELSVLEASEKEVLIEFHGAKYLVAR